jgi:RNA polymerase sigma-70 factor (ECF subfamily)
VTAAQASDVTDLDLVRLAQAGDVDAFGELVERNRRAVFRAALAAVGSPSEAEDVAQEAFVTAWRKLGGFRSSAPGCCRLRGARRSIGARASVDG